MATPKRLIVEFWYKDGDVGAYHAEEATEAGMAAQVLWEGFDTADVDGGKAPSHIVIREETKEGD